MPAVLGKWLLAVVPNRGERASVKLEADVHRGQESSAFTEYFGDNLKKKLNNMLRIGYLNIWGLDVSSNKHKDDCLREGITTFDFDVFGIRETNLDWRKLLEQDKLYMRTKDWWEAAHISFSHNRTQPPTTRQQWGGVALLSINKAAHRVISKGVDPSALGRWCWTRFQGRNRHTLRVFSAYCPNPPTGALTDYAQHRLFLISKGDQRCPRLAFIKDLVADIKEAQTKGDNIVLLLDGNMNMKDSLMANAFTAIGLEEKILKKHGLLGPSTFKRNLQGHPIDGKWASQTLQTINNSYMAYDSITHSEHRCVWLELSYQEAFGHNMPAIARPKTRPLHCKDPKIVNNYINKYLDLASKTIFFSIQYPPSPHTCMK